MTPKIDWSRPIENKYGPCRLLHKLKHNLNPNYVVLSLDERGQEHCLEYNDEGYTLFADYALRNTIERQQVYIPFGVIVDNEQAHQRIAAEFAQASIAETNKPYAIKLTLHNNVPHSVELLNLLKDAE